MHSSVRPSGERLTALIKVDICTMSNWNRSLNPVGILDPVGSTVRALRDDEAVYLVSKGHYETVAVGN